MGLNINNLFTARALEINGETAKVFRGFPRSLRKCSVLIQIHVACGIILMQRFQH
jgi:hypothetical protein